MCCGHNSKVLVIKLIWKYRLRCLCLIHSHLIPRTTLEAMVLYVFVAPVGPHLSPRHYALPERTKNKLDQSAYTPIHQCDNIQLFMVMISNLNCAIWLPRVRRGHICFIMGCCVSLHRISENTFRRTAFIWLTGPHNRADGPESCGQTILIINKSTSNNTSDVCRIYKSPSAGRRNSSTRASRVRKGANDTEICGRDWLAGG